MAKDELDAVARVRLTGEEKDGWKAAASASGMTLSEWIRARCNRPVTDVPLSVTFDSVPISAAGSATAGTWVVDMSTSNTGKSTYSPDPKKGWK